MSLKMGHRAIFQASVLPGFRAPELLLNSEEIAKFTPEVGYWKPGRHGESNTGAAAPKGTLVKSPSGPKTNSRPEKRTQARETNGRTENEQLDREKNGRNENVRPDRKTSPRTKNIRPDRKTND